jgi:hypothetical protein
MALTTGLFGEDAGTLTDGQRKLTNIASTTVGRQVPQWIRNMAINVSEDVAPLDVMLSRLKKPKIVRNPLYNHLETDILQRWVEEGGTTTDSGSDTSFSLTTGHGGRLRVRDLIHVPRTGEVMQVTAISTDDITVTRGFGSSSASAVAQGEDMEIMAMADTEGNTAPDGISSEPSIKQNYTQTAKVSIELSGRALAVEAVGGPELARLLKDASRKLKIQTETALMHGARNTSDPTATGGLDYYITTNTTNAGGALTEATLNSFLKTGFRRNQGNSGNMVFLVGELIIDAIDSHARDNIRYRPDDKVLGIAVGRIKNAHGNVALVKHGLLTVNSDLSGRGYLLNLDLINKVELANRGFNYKPNVETPGTDGRKDYFLSDFGLWLASEKNHSIMSGVTG